MQSHLVATGIPFSEGPVWCPDGTVVVTSVAGGALYRVWPDQERAELMATTLGGANGAALAADGSILVAQNAGMDFSQLPPGLFGDLSEAVPTPGGLQLASPTGDVSYLAQEGLLAPNDIAVAANGDVYFTDPGHYPPPESLIGRVMIYGRDGTLREFARDFYYCNGIAFEPDGSVVVVERLGLQRVHPDGSREWVIENLGSGGGDGFCLDAEGRFYVASTIEHGVRVVEPDGTVADFWPIEGRGLCTNCCFGGPDLRTLYVADAIPGSLVAFAGCPTPGLELPTWPGPA